MIDNYPKAYKEVLEILKYMPKSEVEKIPQEMIDTFEYKKDKNYKFVLNEDADFGNLDLLDETKAIISNIFRDYWATPEQREKIIAKQKYDIQKIEEEKMQKYNPDDLFKKNNDNKENVTIENYNKNLPVEIKKENFFRKLVNYIKGLFKKK